MFPDTGNGKGSEASTSTGMSQRCCQFEFDEILLATDNFNESLVVGKGGFGKVYKGNIKIGTTHVDVAIKRLDLMSNQGSTEFWAEVEMLSKLRHAHLVSLIGYCNYEKEMILVYEYMPHGTLEDHLHKLHTPLSWLERLKICIGAARGLDYLHTGTGTEVCVIHRDVKSSNILLLESWEAKISDFGLARIGPKNQPSTNVYTHVKGTFGYIDPNYFATGKLTRKSDVYAFGVVLFEVLCQKRPLDKSFERGLATWIQESIKEGKLKHIVYSGIRSEISSKCLKGFARIAGRCLNDHPNHRPTMTEVVFSLESLLAQSGENSGVSLSMGVSFLMGISYALYAKEKRQRKRFFKRNGGILLKQAAEVDQSLVDKIILFTPHELAKATDNFNETRVLGRGGQGTVYKGMLVEGRIVAIKKSNVVDESQLEQLINEMVILSQINHRNVVKLLGCCLETEVPLLVYEFISNGTLYDRLHNDTDEFPFSLNLRLQIATEVAGALAYLHSAALIPIYHRDIKTTNILLDDKYRAKVSDFGTSRLVSLDQSHLTTMVKGTFGYLDPEYFQSSQFTEKSDVYSFGVVLVELITGEKPISLTRFGEHRSLATHFTIAMEEGRVVSTFDEKMIKEAIGDELLLIANLAMRCLNLIGKNRPTMKEVVGELETIRTSHIPSTDQTNMNPMIYRVELSKQPYGESTSTFSLDDNISHIGR